MSTDTPPPNGANYTSRELSRILEEGVGDEFTAQSLACDLVRFRALLFDVARQVGVGPLAPRVAELLGEDRPVPCPECGGKSADPSFAALVPCPTCDEEGHVPRWRVESREPGAGEGA